MTVEVKTKLTLDDLASSVLDRIKQGFGTVDDARDAAQQGMGFFGQTLSTLAAVHGPAAIRSMIGFGKSFIDAARDGDSADQALGGLIATMQDIPWARARAEAEELGDWIDEMGIQSGQAIGDVEGAFLGLLEITGATSEGVADAKDKVAQMVPIANVLGKSTAMIAQEYAFMGDGILRTRGQMFQMLKQTGIFGTDVKKAATEWAKLTNEERAKRLSYGLAQVSEKLKAATPTFDDLVNTFNNVVEVTKEKLGEPLLAALKPELMRVTDWLKDNRQQIEIFTKFMAKEVGAWVREASRRIQDGFKYIMTHKQEIADAIKDAFGKAKAVVEWIIAHKEEIALAFGVRAVAPAAGAAYNVASGIAKSGAAEGAPLLGLKGGIGGAVAALAAFTAAVVASKLALDQMVGLEKETGKESTRGAAIGALLGGLPAMAVGALVGGNMAEERKAAEARLRALEQWKENASFEEWTDQELQHLEKVRDALKANAKEVGKTTIEIDQMANEVWRAREANANLVKPMREAAQSFQDLFKQEGGMVDVEQQNQLINTIASGFQNAQSVQNQGAMVYVASLLTKSKDLQTAFLQSANMTAEGFNSLADLVQDKAGDFAESLRGLGKAEAAKASKPEMPKIHMSGGQTFKIQQDFRDQDPDRVAIAFHRDVSRAAVARIAANTSSPFGT